MTDVTEYLFMLAEQAVVWFRGCGATATRRRIFTVVSEQSHVPHIDLAWRLSHLKVLFDWRLLAPSPTVPGLHGL